tara:strand:- start:139 stop:723 length:585 start_codon:yes stop_codon:yes gene_type:complete
MTNVTHTFGAETIQFSEVNQNFTDLTSAIDSLTTTNLHDSAGIVSTQLADRYALSPWSIHCLPFTAAADLATTGSSALFTCASTSKDLVKTTTRVRSSKKASIVFIEIHVIEVAADSGQYPELTIKLDTATIGGSARALDSTGFHYIYNSDPVANPLINFDDNQTLTISISGAGQTPKLRGLTVTCWIKEELTA